MIDPLIKKAIERQQEHFRKRAEHHGRMANIWLVATFAAMILALLASLLLIG